MWCDQAGVGIFKALYFVGKFLGLIALEYDFKEQTFIATFRAATISCGVFVFVAVICPFVAIWYSQIYFASGVDIDQQMSLVAAIQIGFGFATSLFVLLFQLWKRRHICRCANDFRRVLKTLSSEMGCGNIITLEMLFLAAMKLSITMYEVLINFPYLVEYSDIITAKRFVAFFLFLYIAGIAAVFSDIAFVTLLLLARYFRLVNDSLEALKAQIQAGNMPKKELRRLIRLYLRLKRMVAGFAECVDASIFVQTLHSFANMLSNLYALLEFYVADNKHLEPKALVYNVMIFLNICLLVYAAERVQRSSVDLKDSFLDLDANQGRRKSQWNSDVLTIKLWPEVCQVDVLGMFLLNHTFLLFLITYATNFVVIILQFEWNKML